MGCLWRLVMEEELGSEGCMAAWRVPERSIFEALLSFKPNTIRYKGLWVLRRVRVEMELPMEARAIPMGVGLSEPDA
ncbi:hypothetical protein AHAS_Ahas05G0033400 [Arachis hypogaea]